MAEPALGADGGAPLLLRDAGVLVPPKLLAEVPARYPAELHGTGTAGDVVLRLTVDEGGEVSEAAVEAAPHDALAREAVHAAVQLQFSPALLDGEARAVQLVFTYHFQVPAPPPPPAAPRVVVTGLVRSRGTRAPIALARVVTHDGLAVHTDEAGRFRVELPPGRQRLTVSAAGFVTASHNERLEETKALDVVYALTPLRANPFETIVRGERERTELNRVELRSAEIREVPGTMGDPFRVVMVLPGVSSIVSGLAYPVVRGSSPAATGYFLDGVRVPQLFHVFLGPAVVHPDFIEGIDFYAGGAPAKYGRLLGGVIEGRLAKPRDALHFTLYADLLNSGAYLEVPIEKTDTRVTLAGRVSYMGLLIGAISPALTGPDGPRLVADFWDYQARVDQGLFGGKAQLFVFGSSDLFGTSFPASTRTSSLQRITFHRVDGKYRHALGAGELLAEATWGLDLIALESSRSLASDLRFPGQLPVAGRQSEAVDVSQSTLTAKLAWRADLGRDWSLTTAATWDHLRALFTQRLTVEPAGYPPVSTVNETPVAIGNFFAGWAEATYRQGGASATLGLRADHYHLAPKTNHGTLEPRFSVDREVTDTLSVRAALGLYHQPPTFLISLPVIDLAGVAFGVQEVAQVSAGTTWRAWRDLELSADAYVNPMTRTVELGLFDDERFDVDDPGGAVDRPRDLAPTLATARPGLAYGVDLMARWPMKGRWFGWLTLSLLRSTRFTSFTVYDAHGRRTGEAEGQLPYAFDQTLVANAVVSYRFDNGWSLGATLHFNTGRPESGEFGSRTRVPGSGATGAAQWVRVARDRVDRLPPYFRGDVRVSKTWVFDAFTLEWWLDVMNVTVSGEVLGFDYDVDQQGRLQKVPTTVPIILPTLGLKARY